ncbi:alpha/beta hydrolase [Jeotgalibacillus terrae]|uniref:Alpha/beta hydrolase n=1 Tax=Jeotgalibacillus terrae TaxID=587735 RepID=A0ABW5ZH53_9BACL|nr:alpha/beta hydrolase [Jeotgalibacillus terrae]MBM7578694.1 hypothetical protein [Jeotgalibacillus terrae]
MNVLKNTIDSTEYTHIQSGSDTICFMFSGAGYNYDKPLFYYSTLLMIEKGIDVVQIHYSFEQGFLKKPLDEVITEMMRQIDPILSEVQTKHEYSNLIFLGKSLGTIPISCSLMQKTEYNDTKMILLTPLLKLNPVFEGILQSKHERMLVIGDQDPHFDHGKLVALNQTASHTTVIKNANHSLDMNSYDTTESIAALQQVMKEIEGFLLESHKEAERGKN